MIILSLTEFEILVHFVNLLALSRRSCDMTVKRIRDFITRVTLVILV